MTVTLAATIDDTTHALSLSDPVETQPGDLFRLEDEIVQVIGYRTQRNPRLLDKSKVQVIRGVQQTLRAAHTSGTELLGVADAFVAGDDEAEPSPFAAGSGGGGGSGSDAITDPTDIAGCALWLDASTLALADNARVATWPDLSGNGYDATQSVAGNKPTCKTAIQNGLSVVRFDGSVDPQFLALSGGGLGLLNGADGVTLAVVVVNREDAAFGEQDILCASNGGDATKRRLQVSFDTGSHIIEAFASNDDAADENYATSQPYVGLIDQTGDSSNVGPTGTLTMLVAIDPSGPRSAIGLSEGGGFAAPTPPNPASVQPGYVPGPFPSTDSVVVVIGGDDGGLARYPLQDADIAELIVYRRALNARERRLLLEYLSAKWGTL